MRAGTTSLSTVPSQEAAEEILDCTRSVEEGEILSELIDLTPDAAPELPSSAPANDRQTRKQRREKAADDFRPPTPPPASSDRVPRRAAGVRKAHNRAGRSARKAAANKEGLKKPQELPKEPAVAPKTARVPTVTEVLLRWERQEQARLEACTLRGFTKSIFKCFDCRTCGPAVFCQREDNYIKHLGSKGHRRRLFALSPWGCKHCPGFHRAFKTFSQALAHEKSALHLAKTRRN